MARLLHVYYSHTLVFVSVFDGSLIKKNYNTFKQGPKQENSGRVGYAGPPMKRRVW